MVKKTTKIRCWNINLRYFLWTIFGLFLLGGTVFASNYISSSGTSTFDGEISVSNLIFGNTTGVSGQAPSRSLVSTRAANSTTTLTVCDSGCDYTTIQEAVNTIPFLLRQLYLIDASQAGNLNEDLWVPPIYQADIMDETEGSSGGLQIRGNCSAMNQVKLNSVHVTGAYGANVFTLNCFEITGKEPTSDENASVIAYSSNHIQFSLLNLSGNVANSIVLYSSSAHLNRIYLNNEQDYGLFLKRDSKAVVGDTGSDAVIGLDGNSIVSAYRVHDGWIDIVNRSGNMSVSCDRKGGFIKSGIYPLCGDIFKTVTFGDSAQFDLYGDLSTRNIRFITSSVGGVIRGFGSSSNGLSLGAGTATTVTVIPNAFRIESNVSSVTCDSTNEGAIYYDGSANKHYGCDSSTWNALY